MASPKLTPYTHGSFPVVTGTFTIELWVKPTATRALTAEQATRVTGTSNQQYAFFPTHGQSAYAVGHTGAGISVGTNGIAVFELTANSLANNLIYDTALSGWGHVVIVFSGGVPSLFFNGTFVHTGLASGYTVHPLESGLALGHSACRSTDRLLPIE